MIFSCESMTKTGILMTSENPKSVKERLRRGRKMENETRDLAVIEPEGATALLRPLVSPTEALQAWREYQALTAAILQPADYQKIGDKRFKKKSAWRKYMTFYGLTEDDAASRVEVVRFPDGFPQFATAWSVIYSRQGKRSTGYHECHVGERCCPAAAGRPCKREEWSSHTCCKFGCDGREHWAHPGDIPATAHTRAKNRAISDAIGAGEVSAEEMGAPSTPGQQPPPPSSGGQPAVISDPRRKRMYAIGKKAGWTDDEMKKLLARYGFARSTEVTIDKYEEICTKLEQGTEREPGEDRPSPISGLP